MEASSYVYEPWQCGPGPAGFLLFLLRGILPEVEDTPPSVQGDFACGCFLRWDAELKLLTASGWGRNGAESTELSVRLGPPSTEKWSGVRA